MQLTTLKRLEFSAARTAMGNSPMLRLSGHNFIVWVGVSGRIDARTGMMMNLAQLKSLAQKVLETFDHRNLDVQLNITAPTTVQIAQTVFKDLRLHVREPFALSSVEITEEAGCGALVTGEQTSVWTQGWLRADGSLEQGEFFPGMPPLDCAVRRDARWTKVELWLTPATDLLAPSRGTLPIILEFAAPGASTSRDCSAPAVAFALHGPFPTAQTIRVWNTPFSFWEWTAGTDRFSFGCRASFNAAHRLYSPHLTESENSEVYGKDYREHHHGHTYFLQAKVDDDPSPSSNDARIDRRLCDYIGSIANKLNFTNLNDDIYWVREVPCTGENLVSRFSEDLRRAFGARLEEVRLWETPNNQFQIAF